MARSLFSFLNPSPNREGEGDPIPANLLAALRQGKRSQAEPPAWFATSVLARLHREEAERAARRARRQHWARILIPSGLAALFLLFLGVGLHKERVTEQDQLTFAALDAIAQGAKGEGNTEAGTAVPLVVEGVSWSTR